MESQREPHLLGPASSARLGRLLPMEARPARCVGLVFTLLRMAALVVLYVVLARILLLMGAQRVLTAAQGATRVLAGHLRA